jgi:hypothetical protein
MTTMRSLAIIALLVGGTSPALAANCTADRRLSASRRWCSGESCYVRTTRNGRYPRSARTAFSIYRLPALAPLHCHTAHARLWVVAARRVSLVSLRPGTLGILV